MKAKRVSKKAQSDRISTLPQTIIEFILCFLPIEEAARTSILSKEWRYKWTTIPKLVFNAPTWSERKTKNNQLSDMELTSKLFHAIHQVLLLHQGPIHEFALSMSQLSSRCPTYSCFEIDQMLLHLSRNHTIKKLTLQLYASDWYSLPSSMFSLPSSMFSLHHLKDLRLENFVINYKPIFSEFGSLTSLSLKLVRFSRETLLHLLSNCPSLKSLFLHLFDEDLFYDRTRVQIPTIMDEVPTIMELLKCLPMVEHLTIWDELITPLVRARDPQEFASLLIHLKYFCFREMCTGDVSGFTFLAILMKCSPNLEKIKLELVNDCCEVHEPYMSEECSVILKEYSDVWLEQMNVLEIEHFVDYYKHLMEFMKFILARSPNLKKLILKIDYCDNFEFVKFILALSPKLKKLVLLTRIYDKDEELKMLKSLLRIPSPVEIIVENYFNWQR